MKRTAAGVDRMEAHFASQDQSSVKPAEKLLASVIRARFFDGRAPASCA